MDGLTEAVKVYNEDVNAVRIYYFPETEEVQAEAYVSLDDWSEFDEPAIDVYRRVAMRDCSEIPPITEEDLLCFIEEAMEEKKNVIYKMVNF